MEQRRLRLGDILDDYCPRERRVTNHAIVAMIEEDIKQTRCTTCDAEHAYKGGKLPRRRKKETPAALYKEVLAGLPEGDLAPALAIPASALPVDVMSEPESLGRDTLDAHDTMSDDPADPVSEPDASTTEEPRDEALPGVDEGPVHRPLIRATLPRPDGQKDARPLPEFTIRQAAARGGNGHFRGPRAVRGHAATAGNGTGNRMAGPRFPGARAAGQGRGPRPDHGRGPGGGRPAQGRGGQGGGFKGRKRSR